LRALRTDVDAGRFTGNEATVSDLLDRWLDLASEQLSPTTLREYRRLIARRIRPALGRVSIAKLTTPQLDEHHQAPPPPAARTPTTPSPSAASPRSADQSETAPPAPHRPHNMLRAMPTSTATSCTVYVNRRDMRVEVRVHATDDRARFFYDGHSHPFSLKWSRGGTYVPGRRPCRAGCANSQLGHALERGVPRSTRTPVDKPRRRKFSQTERGNRRP
jgi:hypothetical protein